MTNLPTISEGATGPVVEWAQYLLVRRTLSDNQIDGIFGPVTKAAVEVFQGYSHLAVDGIVGPDTWAALGGDAPQPPALAEGSQGPVVQQLQTALTEGRGDFAPSSNPVLAVDGIYGPQTAVDGGQGGAAAGRHPGGRRGRPADVGAARERRRHGARQPVRRHRPGRRMRPSELPGPAR